MNKFVGLLIVIGLAVAGYVNRDKISTLRGGAQRGEVAAEGEAGSVATGPSATPHPAKEGMAEAMRLYPGLKVAGSELNKRFLALHSEAVTGDPALLARPDWPVTIAERAVVSLGGAPQARATPAPVHGMPKASPGSLLDAKPKEK